MSAAAFPNIESATIIFDRGPGLRAVTVNPTICNAGASAPLWWSFGTRSDALVRGLRHLPNITASMNYQMSRYGVAHDGTISGRWLAGQSPVSTTAIRGEHDALC